MIVKIHSQVTRIFSPKFDDCHRHIAYNCKSNVPVSTEKKNLNYLWVAFNNKNRDFVDFVEK